MDSGTENLDATARVVRRIVTFTQAGGVIHLIVTGVNVGAQSYWDALATMLMHTRGVLIMTPQASMVLTGQRGARGVGLGGAEDEVAIGGHERVMGPNGQAQYFATDLLARVQHPVRALRVHLRGAGRARAAPLPHQRPGRARRARSRIATLTRRAHGFAHGRRGLRRRRRTPAASARSRCAR